MPAASTRDAACAASPRAFQGARRACARSSGTGDSAMGCGIYGSPIREGERHRKICCENRREMIARCGCAAKCRGAPCWRRGVFASSTRALPARYLPVHDDVTAPGHQAARVTLPSITTTLRTTWRSPVPCSSYMLLTQSSTDVQPAMSRTPCARPRCPRVRRWSRDQPASPGTARRPAGRRPGGTSRRDMP